MLLKTHEFGWDRNLVWAHLLQIPGSTTGKKIDFRFNYWPDCSSMIFQNFLGRGSPKPLPRLLPHSISLRPRFGHRPQFTTPNHVYFLSTEGGYRSNTICSPNLTVSVSSQDPIQGLYCSNITKLDWNIPLIKTMMAGWKNFLKIHRDDYTRFSRNGSVTMLNERSQNVAKGWLST